MERGGKFKVSFWVDVVVGGFGFEGGELELGRRKCVRAVRAGRRGRKGWAVHHLGPGHLGLERASCNDVTPQTAVPSWNKHLQFNFKQFVNDQ